MHINNLASLVDVRANVVSHESGKEMQMVVPDKGLWGTAGIDGLNIDQAIKSETIHTHAACSMLPMHAPTCPILRARRQH